MMAIKDAFQIRMLMPGDDPDMRQIQNVVAQLAPDYPPPGKAAIGKIINSQDSKMFVVMDKSQPPVIIGVMVVLIIRLLTCTKVQIEDVVVDHRFRGLGIGKRLLQSAISLAAEIGAAKIDLTSTPDKVEANGLYKKLGFKLRNTNVYRLEL